MSSANLTLPNYGRVARRSANIPIALSEVIHYERLAADTWNDGVNGSPRFYTRFELLAVDADIANDGCSNPPTRTVVTALTNAVTVKLIPSAMKPAFRP